LKDEFIYKPPELPPFNKPRHKWTIKENTGWLKVRGITKEGKMSASELKVLVEFHHTSPRVPPPVLPDTRATLQDVRHLLVLLYRVCATLFSTDLKGIEAGNRFEALVVQFLVYVEKMGKACCPTKIQPVWQSKYGILGLLRCRQHFIDYTYVHSLYEGGIEGEGMVKELRPLCPQAVRSGWPYNLMNAYNRQNILASLTSGFQSSSYVESPTAGQHDANGKNYKAWADVKNALQSPVPVSLVVLGTEEAWKCHVLVRMFQVTYTREIIIGGAPAMVDPLGFVYHSIRLGEDETLHDTKKPVLNFALMLPHTNDDGSVQFCVVDKDWRFVGAGGAWTYFD
jgi:hypothetical protein